MDFSNPLTALAMAERRFDGPIPPELRRAAMGGPGHAAAAAARSVLFDRLARHAASALARSRAQGSPTGSPAARARLAGDLRLYRQAGVAWRDLADDLSRR